MTWVVAHRGAPLEAPDNSLEGFALAIEAGADMLELDVRRAPGGALVASHDPVRAGAAGLATLDEVLALARGRVRLDVEIKEGATVQDVCAALRAGFDVDALVVTSFEDRALVAVGRFLPAARTGLLFGGGRLSTDRLWRCGADYAAPHLRLARRGGLERAAAAGYPSLVWTVNEDADLAALLPDPRVAGVITDVPRRAVALRGAAS